MPISTFLLLGTRVCWADFPAKALNSFFCSRGLFLELGNGAPTKFKCVWLRSRAEVSQFIAVTVSPRVMVILELGKVLRKPFWVATRVDFMCFFLWADSLRKCFVRIFVRISVCEFCVRIFSWFLVCGIGVRILTLSFWYLPGRPHLHLKYRGCTSGCACKSTTPSVLFILQNWAVADAGAAGWCWRNLRAASKNCCRLLPHEALQKLACESLRQQWAHSCILFTFVEKSVWAKRLVMFFSLTEPPLPDPTPTPQDSPESARNGLNWIETDRNGSNWTFRKLSGVGDSVTLKRCDLCLQGALKTYAIAAKLVRCGIDS